MNCYSSTTLLNISCGFEARDRPPARKLSVTGLGRWGDGVKDLLNMEIPPNPPSKGGNRKFPQSLPLEGEFRGI